jgi:ribosomal protein S18 acetylase RimI-like enzyme
MPHLTGLTVIERSVKDKGLGFDFWLGDISKYQRLGIGSELINNIIREPAELNIPVWLRVMAVNPANNLYEHLGFVVIETILAFFVMEKTPSNQRLLD